MTLATPETAAPEQRKPDPPALVWWKRLRHPSSGNPGALAQLRRCRSTAEAMRLREAVTLAVRTGSVRGGAQAPDWKVRAALDLARVLAHVKEHEPGRHPMKAAGWKRFAGERRESDAGDDRPVMAESRFRRLLQTGDGEEKVAAFVRLAALIDGRVDVAVLARDFIDWNDPVRGDRVRERWAFIYYGAASAAPTLPDTDADPEDDE